jgi:hypothetical protein
MKMLLQAVNQIVILLMLVILPPGLACRCIGNSTIETSINEENTSIFHGTVLRELSLTQSDHPSWKKYDVLVRKVYKTGCSATAPPPPPQLRSFQRITITTPRNSCGFQFRMLQSVVFSGQFTVIAVHDWATTTTETTHLKDRIRKRIFPSITSKSSMTVTLCGFTKPWMTVSQSELEVLRQYSNDHPGGTRCVPGAK